MGKGKRNITLVQLYAPVIAVVAIIIYEIYEYYFIFTPVYWVDFSTSVSIF